VPGQASFGPRTFDGGFVVAWTNDGKPSLVSYSHERFESATNIDIMNQVAFDERNREWVRSAPDLPERYRRLEKIFKCGAARAKQKSAERNGIKRRELDSGPQTRDEWCCKAKSYLDKLREMMDARLEWESLACDELPGSLNHGPVTDRSKEIYNDFKATYEKRCLSK